MKTKTAVIELLKDSRDLRVFFRGCCNTSAFRLRSQAYRFRDELAQRGGQAALEDVQDKLFELARDLFPDSPAVDFVAWGELLCGDAMSRLQEHYSHLSPEEREAVDLSRAWETNDDIVAACEAEDLDALREALRSYEREALAALNQAKQESGAA